MWEFITICFTGVNAIFTAGLLTSIAYWVLFLTGAVDTGLLDGDADVSLPVGDATSGVQGSLELAEGASGVGGGDVEHAPGDVSSAWLSSVVNWILPHGLPLTVLATILMTSAWALTILGSAWGNNREVWSNWELLSWAWGAGSLLLSLPLSRLIAWPLSFVFKQVDAGLETQFVVMGKSCIISTSKATSSFGQAQILRDGGPITLNVRTRPGVTLRRGEEAIITDCDVEQRVYFVVPFHLEQKIEG